MCEYKDVLLGVVAKYQDANKWIDSDFESVKRLSNSKVGDVGQDFIEELCNKFGFSCEFPETKGKRARQCPWDVKIEGVEFELKTATEDVGGSFQFNHLRYHRPYDAAICLGIAPNSVLFDIWSKADIVTGKAGNLVSMEKGANASYKLTKRKSALRDIDEFQDVLKEFIEKFQE
jgi:hypothetical protein